MTSANPVKYILIVEDEERVRTWIRDALKDFYSEWQYLEAEHMEQADELAKGHWDDIVLIVMDVMLPKDETDADAIKELIQQREPVYDKWLELEDKGLERTDHEWLKARFAVDVLDRKIFKMLRVQGGIELVENWARTNGGKLDKCVLYLTARENQAIRDRGMALVETSKVVWQVKPITSPEIRVAVKKLGLMG